MKHKFKRVLSLALVLCMIVSQSCISYASSGTDTETTAAEISQEAAETTAETSEEVTEETEEVSEESTESEEATGEVTEESAAEETEEASEESTESEEATEEVTEESVAEETEEVSEESSESEEAAEEAAEESAAEETEEASEESTKSEEVTEESAVEETEEVSEESAKSEETTGKVTEESVAEESIETEEVINETVSGSEIAVASEDDISVASTTTGTKPDDGTTTGQPFSSGTGGSTYFRIPAMVTLDDGTIVAACDARWDGSSDGYGLDTIVSRSTDGGATWSYTFANYLGDNGNALNSSSTAFIDPCLATDGETVYMLVDLYPGGTVISNAQAGTGYDSDGHLMLKASGSSSYDYYLGDFDSDGYAYIYNYSTGAYVAGYTVDQWFNVYVQGTLESNLFYSDCTYTVLPTSYLYLTTSTDGGATWSAPTMLNSQVKTSSDYFYGVGPGSALVTSTGRIIYACYTYSNGSDGNTSVIYSDDGGKTWTRSADMSSQSSEATMVEADGTIYMFTRHGGYYYSTDNGTTWSTKQTVSGISYTTSCQINAMVYSEKIDGKTAILLSAPTSDRTTGKIFVGLVQDDGSIDWAYTYSVNGSNTYQYSCLAELSDGTVALLYESGSAAITYTTLDIADIASGATIGSETTVTDETTGITATAGGLTAISVTKYDATTSDDGSVSIAYDINLNGGYYTGAATVTIPVDEAFANCDSFSAVVYNDDASDADDVEVTVSGSNLVLSVPHFSTVLVTGTTSGTTTATETAEVTVYVGYTTTITDETGDYESDYNASGVDTDIASVTVTGTTVEGGTTVEKITSITSDSSYYISDGNGNYLVLSSSNLTTTTDVSSATQWTVTSSGSGYQISCASGSNTYYLRYNSGSLTITTRSSQATTWSYSSNTGFYYSSSSMFGGTTVYYLAYSNGWTLSTSTSNYGAPYTVTTTDPVDATTIAITGVAVGTTSVVVGNTQYNITVEEAPEYVTKDTSPFISGTGNYSGQVVTKLTLDVGASYDLNISSDYSGTVTWASGDTSIATVDENGTVTGISEGTTTVYATIDGVTYTMIVVVLQSYGSTYTCDLYISEITNTSVVYSINLSTDVIDAQEGEIIYLLFDYNFCINFFGVEDDGYALTFMASTNSAGNYYAVTSDGDVTDQDAYKAGAMYNQISPFGAATVQNLLNVMRYAGYHGTMGWTRSGSNGNIYSNLTFRSRKLPTVEKEITSITHDGTTTAYTEGMTAEAGDVITYTVTVTQYATTEAIEYTYETLTDNLSGATFKESNTYTTTPTLSDETLNEDGVTTYTVTYTITDDDLDTTITNTVDLTYTYKAAYSSGSFGGSANAEASFVATSFQGVDLVVDFGLPVSYTYEAWGKDSVTLESTGSASYGTVAVTGDRTNGWTVTYTPNTVLKGVDTVTLSSTSGATYTFKVYPATTVYYEEGFATFGTGTSVATDGSWSTTGSKGSDPQQTHVANVEDNNYNNYNYDGAYNSDTTGSNGTQATSVASGDSLKFSFKGTGVDLFANCTSGTAIVTIRVLDENNSVKKMLTVNTAEIGSYATDGTAYNTPIASISGLDYGSYTVVVYVSSAGVSTTFNFDGFRVYDTCKNDDSANAVYTADLEDNPSYYELRNNILAGLSVDTSSSTYKDDIATGVAQVYANSTDSLGAVVVYSFNSGLLMNNTTVQELLDDGPKNELYLDTNASVVFKITTNREVQIGLRSVTGASVTYTISDGTTTSTYTTSSSVDMFYTLQAKSSSDATETTYTITVTSGGILSITDIKVSDCNDESIFGTLTADEVVAALTGETSSSEDADDTGSVEDEGSTEDTGSTGDTSDAEDTGSTEDADNTQDTGNTGDTEDANDADSAYKETDAEVTADAALTINLVDYTGSVIAVTGLTVSGTEGESVVFAAGSILTAVNEVLPDGYALVDEDGIADQTVICGESGSVDIQIGKVATLTVTYQKYNGLFRKTTVDVVTLTKVQTGSDSRAVFTSTEIREAVPDGYKVLAATSASVNYGSTGTRTVTVY